MAVKRIDIVQSPEKTPVDSFFQCHKNKMSEYSPENEKLMNGIQGRIYKIESYLKTVADFKKPMNLIVTYKEPLQFLIDDDSLTIGSDLLKSQGHLERGLIKFWLKNYKTFNHIDISLTDEVITDFVYFLIHGQLTLEDPKAQIQTRLGKVLWPQVLKNSKSYCDSSWKRSEDFQICRNLDVVQIGQLSEKIASLSVRPLLSNSIIAAYQKMNFKSQMRLAQNLEQLFNLPFITSEKIIEMIMQESNPLKQGVLAIKNFSNYLNSSEISQLQEFQAFYSLTALELQSAGVSDSFAQAYFDILIEIPDELDVNSVFFKAIEKASLENMNLQVAIKDHQNIWIMPSKTYLPQTAFDDVKAKQTVYFACLNLKQISIQKFYESTEKLMMVKGCSQNENYKMASLFSGGIKDFSKVNPQMKFVQFHMPSLEMKQQELSHVVDYFKLVENRDMNSPEFRTLGWVQIQWSDEYYAYKPKAIVDAIEFFRN